MDLNISSERCTGRGTLKIERARRRRLLIVRLKLESFLRITTMEKPHFLTRKLLKSTRRKWKRK